MADPMERTSFDNSFLNPGANAPKSWKVSKPWIIMLFSGLIAFVAFIAVTQQNRATTLVAVADSNIAYGTPADQVKVEFVKTFVPQEANIRLLTQADFEKLPAGSVADRSIAKGTFIYASDFSQQASLERTLSFSVDPADANAGDLHTDDVIDIVNDQGVEVGHRLRLVSVGSQDSSAAFGGADSSNLTLTVAVPNDQVASVVRQTIQGKFKVVKNNNNPQLDN